MALTFANRQRSGLVNKGWWTRSTADDQSLMASALEGDDRYSRGLLDLHWIASIEIVRAVDETVVATVLGPILAPGFHRD